MSIQTPVIAAVLFDVADSRPAVAIAVPKQVGAAVCCTTTTPNTNPALQDRPEQLAPVGSFGSNAIRGEDALQPSLAVINIASASQIIPPDNPVRPISPQRKSLSAQSYAYSFWRNGSAGGSLASGGQYGGGQSGFITTIALQPDDRRDQAQRLALLFRATVAHDDIKEREIGIGVRWRPTKTVPLTITAERRLRHDRGDAFALYAAGGANAVGLPLAFKLEGFAQTGVVGGDNGGAFFDGFVRADRAVAKSEHMSLHLGAGSWAGGQRGAARLDVGPSLRSDIDIFKTQVRVTADWRFRIAGDARPGNGPALTLSTGF